jgi:hypothetical protein
MRVLDGVNAQSLAGSGCGSFYRGPLHWKHAYLNPMPDPRISPQRGFAAGGDGGWVCSLFYTGFQSDLGSFYILSILLLLSYSSFASGLSFFRLLK